MKFLIKGFFSFFHVMLIRSSLSTKTYVFTNRFEYCFPLFISPCGTSLGSTLYIFLTSSFLSVLVFSPNPSRSFQPSRLSWGLTESQILPRKVDIFGGQDEKTQIRYRRGSTVDARLMLGTAE